MPAANRGLADLFQEMADLLEVTGGNGFRVRAYRNAARTLDGMPRPLGEYVAEGGRIEDLVGFGKDLAAKARVALDTGTFPQLEALRRQVPKGVLAFLRVPGLGARKAEALQAAGITDLAALRRACEEGRVRRLPGFGPTSEAKLLRELGRLKAGGQRRLWAEVLPEAQAVVDWLQSVPGVATVQAAGSFRRRVPTVGDLDVVAAAADAKAVRERFLDLPGVVEASQEGERRCRVRLLSGLHVDLRIIVPESAGAALVYFTGSKEHNVHLRRLGIARGLKVNEYGVFRGRGREAADGSDTAEGARTADVAGTARGAGTAGGAGDPEDATDVDARRGGGGAAEAQGERVAGATEEEVYAAVGLPWIAPELREDEGEFAAAQEGRLPALVRREDVRGDLHAHTHATDGRHSIAQMAAAAKALGHAYLSISDHSKRTTIAKGLDEAAMRRHLARIEAARAQTKGIRLLKSAEVDILKDGTLDYPDDLLEEMDVVVASVHFHRDLPAAQQTERVVRALRHPLVDVLGHPTGRLLGRREGLDLDVEGVFAVAAETGTALEINCQPDRLDLEGPLARRARDAGCRLVVSTDAHTTGELRNLELGVAQARRGWLTKEDVLNTRGWGDLKKALKRHR